MTTDTLRAEAFAHDKTIAEGIRQQAHHYAHQRHRERVFADEAAAAERNRLANANFDELKAQIGAVEGEPSPELWQLYHDANQELDLSGVPLDHKASRDTLDADIRAADASYHQAAREAAARHGVTIHIS